MRHYNKKHKGQTEEFFDNIDKWAKKEQGASGLAYFTFEKNGKISGKGPVGKFFSEEALKEIMKICSAEIGDSIFLACGKVDEVEKILSISRDKIAKELNLIDKEILLFVG